MSDEKIEKFEEFLRREAAAYNTPPATAPRDEMWQVIAAERAAARARPALDARAPGRSRWRMAPWIGMAATLLIGVGIGRYAMQRGANDAGSTLAANVPSAPSSPAAAPAPATGSATDAASDPGVTRSADATAPLQRSQRRTPARAATVSNVSNGGGTIDPATPMQVASREHLVRAEALISVVSASAADLAIDSLTSRWAQSMLTSTRLLLDSPAGEDPARRRLLEDLETVLVQLVQRSGAPADERELLNRSLQRTQLLTRLRTSATGL